MIDELPDHLDKPFNKTIEPEEKLVLAIETYRRAPSKTSVPIPNALFSQNDRNLYQECNTLIGKYFSTNSQLPL